MKGNDGLDHRDKFLRWVDKVGDVAFVQPHSLEKLQIILAHTRSLDAPKLPTEAEELAMFQDPIYRRTLRHFMRLHRCEWVSDDSKARLFEYMRVEAEAGPWFYLYFYRYIDDNAYGMLAQLTMKELRSRAQMVQSAGVLDGKQRKRIKFRLWAIEGAVCAAAGVARWWGKTPTFTGIRDPQVERSPGPEPGRLLSP